MLLFFMLDKQSGRPLVPKFVSVAFVCIMILAKQSRPTPESKYMCVLWDGTFPSLQAALVLFFLHEHYTGESIGDVQVAIIWVSNVCIRSFCLLRSTVFSKGCFNF